MRHIRSFSLAAVVVLVILTTGCEGFMRGCSSDWANHMGGDWVIVQMDMDGHPFRCWELNDVSVGNEEASDGIYWRSERGHLVRISGLYNQVQVTGRNWDSAYAELGISRETCQAISTRRFSVEANDYVNPNAPRREEATPAPHE